MVFQWSLSDSQSHLIPRTLLSILADFNNAVVWMVLFLPPISNSSRTVSTFCRPFQVHQLQLISPSRWPSGRDYVICLFLKIPEKFMRLILQEEFWLFGQNLIPSKIPSGSPSPSICAPSYISIFANLQRSLIIVVLWLVPHDFRYRRRIKDVIFLKRSGTKKCRSGSNTNFARNTHSARLIIFVGL